MPRRLLLDGSSGLMCAGTDSDKSSLLHQPCYDAKVTAVGYQIAVTTGYRLLDDGHSTTQFRILFCARRAARKLPIKLHPLVGFYSTAGQSLRSFFKWEFYIVVIWLDWSSWLLPIVSPYKLLFKALIWCSFVVGQLL
jgi:hypothetical protein